jgi:dUTP pyrophosphatase
MHTKIKKMHPDAKLPKYAKEHDLGADLVAVAVLSETDTHITYDLGIAIETAPGIGAFLYPRSSICNYDLALSNSVGVGDPGYRNNYRIVFNKTNGASSKVYKVGDRVCQLVLAPVITGIFIETEELSPSDRGLGGYGSSGT